VNRSRREVTPVLFGVRQRGSELGTAVQRIVVFARVNHQRCRSAQFEQSGPTPHVARRDRDQNDLALMWKPAVAIITGGASGIGRGTVELFVKEGASAIGADVQDDKGARLVEEYGGKVSYLHCDVANEEDVKAMVAYAIEKFGRLDCLSNNAEIPGSGGPIADTPVEEIDSVIAVGLRGVFLGIKHAAPIMCKQKSGSIIRHP
jgi:hypothetical protein